jgi:microfibrillar-associated protein 1
LAHEKEREEIERRRALPEEQRMKEDLDHAKKLREEKPKGQQKFLQKFWHKGAFHQVSKTFFWFPGHAEEILSFVIG